MRRCAGIVLLAIFAAAISLEISAAADPVSTVDAGNKLRFDIPAGPLDKALRDFAALANRNVSYEPSIVAGLFAPAIKGNLTVGEALSLLLAHTKLRAVDVDQQTIQVVQNSAPSTRIATPRTQERQAAHADAAPETARDAQQTRPMAGADRDSNESATASAELRSRSELTEITVTGTHIRGTKDSASPTLVYTQADIDATGSNTIQQFLQALPQNFGGASENTIGSIAANSQTNNTVNGSAPNLRGLGADATLVLVNGHRVAPGNSDGSFVDISMIPLTAVERIEIVTDGASAIYGSDAVGGVVNIILRHGFEGAETRAQYGSVSSGSMHNVQVGETVGERWAKGSAVLSYQYFDQTRLSAGSRDYLHSVPLPFDLLPEQVQHSAFVNIEQEVAENLSVHGDAIYSHRSTNSAYSFGDVASGFSATSGPSVIDGYSASLGASLKLPRESALSVSAIYSESDTSEQSLTTPSATPLQISFKTKSSITSLDVNLDGALLPVPAGSIQYAVGAQYRKETFGNTYLLPPQDNTFYPRRNVGAAYLELHVPLVSGAHDDAALALTVADRGEHHSDFGSANNPQVGVIWKPLSDMSFRGTYGTSFKAPLLSELNPVPAQVLIYPGSVFNPVPGGVPNTLIVDGGNPGLKPEKATTWTVGFDLKPRDSGLSVKLTYYNIVFKDEIIVAGASICGCNAFVDETVLGPDIIQRNPSPALVQHLISFPTFQNPFNIDPATVGAIYDSRSMNLSTLKTRGLDFGLGHKSGLFGAEIDTGLDGNYILALANKFTATAPVASIVDTVYNPTKLRLRGRALATVGPWSGGLYVNFANAYADNNVTPSGHVSSWTTVDAVLTYDMGPVGVPFQNASISLSAVNLADRDPPSISNPFGYPITYDGANANAMGRYISIHLWKRW